LPRDAEQQKYSEIAALVSVTVGRERFRNAEPRFHTAWVKTGSIGASKTAPVMESAFVRPPGYLRLVPLATFPPCLKNGT
jgi:hypothetical protein